MLFKISSSKTFKIIQQCLGHIFSKLIQLIFGRMSDSVSEIWINDFKPQLVLARRFCSDLKWVLEILDRKDTQPVVGTSWCSFLRFGEMRRERLSHLESLHPELALEKSRSQIHFGESITKGGGRETRNPHSYSHERRRRRRKNHEPLSSESVNKKIDFDSATYLRSVLSYVCVCANERTLQHSGKMINDLQQSLK